MADNQESKKSKPFDFLFQKRHSRSQETTQTAATPVKDEVQTKPESASQESDGNSSTPKPASIPVATAPQNPPLALNSSTMYPKAKKKKSFGQRVGNLFRNIGIFTVLILVIISSALAYILINPDSEFSNFVVNKTPINKLLALRRSNTDSNSNPQTSSADTEKPANNFFGLNPDAPTSSNQNTVQVVNKVLPSVLSISVRVVTNRSVLTAGAAGTGYVVNSDGLVVTNKHVIAQVCEVGINNVQISALTYDQQVFELKVVAIDPIDDIAILQIQNPPQNLSPVSFSDSNKLQLGESVIAIGNALGELQNTVTTGVISGLNRSLNEGPIDECTKRRVNTDGLIQTDAAINKGNSGGPLFNSNGQLIGMNTFGTSEAQNVGLAIPSSSIQSALQSFTKNKNIIRPRLGIFSRPITPIERKQLDWVPVDYGEIILSPSGEPAVASGSAAQQSGLAEGDIILEMNGVKLAARSDNPSPLRRVLLTLEPQQKTQMTVLKATKNPDGTYKYNNESTKIDVVLGGVSFDLNQLQLK
jgi:serine protease Do